MIASNTFTSDYHYRLYKNTERGVFAINFIPCVCPGFLLNFINIGCQIVLHSLNQDILVLETVTVKKYLKITPIGSSWNS